MPIRSAPLGAAVVIYMAAAAPSQALCTRLPLSDVALEKPTAIAAARDKLDAYAVETLKQRGWSGKGRLRSHGEAVSCQPYLSLGSIAAGYRCRVTATFCAPQSPRRVVSAIGKVVRLRLKGSDFEISGKLKKFNSAAYVITPPNSGDVTVPAHRFECIGAFCPKAN